TDARGGGRDGGRVPPPARPAGGAGAAARRPVEGGRLHQRGDRGPAGLRAAHRRAQGPPHPHALERRAEGPGAMTPVARTQYEQLPRGEAAGGDAAGDRFEGAWKAAVAGGEPPCLPPYFAGLGELERTVLAWELIALDRAYRERRGESPRPEDYRDL